MKKSFFIFFLSLFLSGCASQVGINPLTDTELEPTQEVQILTSIPSGPFLKIAHLSIKGNVKDPTRELIEQAKQLGADAIVMQGDQEVEIPYMMIGSKTFYKSRVDMTALAIIRQQSFAFPKTESSVKMLSVAEKIQTEKVPEMANIEEQKKAEAEQKRAEEEKKQEAKKQAEEEKLKKAEEKKQQPTKEEKRKIEEAKKKAEKEQKKEKKQIEEEEKLFRDAKRQIEKAMKKSGKEIEVEPEEKNPEEAKPVAVEEKEAVETPAQPVGPDHFYAVLETEHAHSYQGRSTRTNYLMITKTTDRKSCMDLVRVPKEDYVFADCLKNEPEYDRAFENQPIGEWYVTYQAIDGTEKAVIIRFGSKQDAYGNKEPWHYDDSLQVAKELRDKIYARSQETNMDAKIRVFSPKEELNIS